MSTKDLYFFRYVNKFFIRCAKFIFAPFFFCFACAEKQGISYCSIFLLGSPPFPQQGWRSWEGRGGGAHPHILADQLTSISRNICKYRVLKAIQMKLTLLCVWAERAILGSAKTALNSNMKFK